MLIFRLLTTYGNVLKSVFSRFSRKTDVVLSGEKNKTFIPRIKSVCTLTTIFLMYRLALKVNTAPIIHEQGELKRSVTGSYWTDCTCFHFIRHLRKIAKSDCKHKSSLSFCLSVCLSVSVCLHAVTHFPLGRFSWTLIFDCFVENLPRKLQVY